MSKAVLIVEPNDARRAAIRQACAARGLQVLEVAEAMAGLAALGRADFGAVIVAEGKRHLSLRGLVQLARKRHSEIRIFVILGDAGNADSVTRILGEVSLVPPDWGVEQLASATTEAIEALGGPAPNPWSGDSAAVEDVPERVALPPIGADPDDDFLTMDLHLEGALEEGSGAGLLMAAFSQELTGKITMKDDAGQTSASLYLFQGEPAWAERADGDATLHRRLVNAGALPVDAEVSSVAQGELLASLVGEDRITAEDAAAVVRAEVRDVVLQLATADGGSYEFDEERGFLSHEPPVRLNPFGLIFESRRAAYTPDMLLALGSEIGGKYLVPGPALAVSAEKIAPFLSGVDVSEQIDGNNTVDTFFNASGLDSLMGTLMILTMRDAQLVSLTDSKRISDDSVVNVSRDSVVTRREDLEVPHTPAPAATAQPPSLTDGDPVTEQESLIDLIKRMTPLTQPAQVLGVPVHAEGHELEEAYQARMSELDVGRVPEGAQYVDVQRALLALQQKVQSAFDTLKLERPAGGDPTRDSNPF